MRLGTRLPSRCYSSAPIPYIFNPNHKLFQKSRTILHLEESRKSDYLKDEIADRLVDRLLDIKRKFSVIADIGSGAGHMIKYLDEGMADKLVQLDYSDELLHRDANQVYNLPTERRLLTQDSLPLEENSVDAILSGTHLHWENDLLGSLVKIRRCLKPDGVFLGAILGGDTLYELRTSLQLAEIERQGGISPHVSPMADVKDMGGLLSRAGFSLTTVDIDEIIVNYPTMVELMDDLKLMGENNAIASRQRNGLHRDTLLAAASVYQSIYGNKDGSIPATFQVIYLIGWKPDPTQAKPLERGSAKKSMKQALEK